MTTEAKETGQKTVEAPTGRERHAHEPHYPNEIDFIILGRKGHVRTAWDRNVPAEVQVARSQFDELRRKGYRVYTVNRRGERDEEVTEFDPEEEEYLFALPLAGGA